MIEIVLDEVRQARIADLVRETGAIAREMMLFAALADRAAARGDTSVLRDAAEVMLPLHVRFAEVYRTLLAVETTPRVRLCAVDSVIPERP